MIADRLGRRETAAGMAGVSAGQLRRWINGESGPPFEELVALADGAGVSLDWLARGQGPMEKIEGALASPEALEHSYLVPRYDIKASAGHGAAIESEQIVDYVAFKRAWINEKIKPSSPANLVLVSSVGDSMMPTIKSGDLLLVDTGDTSIRDHAIYALSFSGQLVVKRLQRRPDGSVLIISDNAAYKMEEVAPGEVSSLRVVGRVVWIGLTI
jgi:phage repressor protein C with HTH and peptisase S24 domain